MPLAHIAEHFAEPGGKGGGFLPGIQVGDIANPQGPELGGALLAFLGHHLCHGGGSQGDALPQDKGRYIP